MQNNNNGLTPTWVVDGRYVYVEGKPLKRADPQTFTVLNELYGRDASGLFCRTGHVSAIVDPATFEVLDRGYDTSRGYSEYAGYARDRDNVYFAEDYSPPRVVRGADAATFVSLGFAYGRDAKRVYLKTKPIRGALPESFELLNALYARDARHVYYYGRLIEGAIASEFALIDEFHGRDNQRVYDRGRPSGEDAPAAAEPRLPHRSGWLKLVMFLGSILLLLSSIASVFRRQSKTQAEVEHSPWDRAPDIRVLAQTLAMGDEEALAPVLLAIDDPSAFVEQYSGRGSFADEPDYQSLIEEAEDESEPVHPFTILQEVFHARGLLGIIDWRSEPDETIGQVERMLHRFGIRDFDWSFIDVLDEHGDGSEMKNQNFLSLLRDRLQPLGLTFVSIDTMGDNYGFAVVRAEDYPKIAGCTDPERFTVSTEFGADEDYERGKRILAEKAPLS